MDRTASQNTRTPERPPRAWAIVHHKCCQSVGYQGTRSTRLDRTKEVQNSHHRFDESHSHDIVPEIFLPARGKTCPRRAENFSRIAQDIVLNLQPANHMF